MEKISVIREQILQNAAIHFPKMVQLRHEFHRFPELSGKEKETARRICELLDELEIPYQKEIAGYGIVAHLVGEKCENSRVVALRADMDALPIQEENDFDYRSINEKVMHACGHDFHIATLLGTLMILHTMKSEWSGCVKAIFQPSEEEYSGGAPFMIAAGALENPKPNLIFGIHADPNIKTGQVGFHSGAFMASTDELHFEILGKGGHAARPHETVNPVIVGAKILVTLETEIAKLKPESSPFVLNFGKFIGDGATNIVPDKVSISGTLRMFDEKKRKIILDKIQEIAQNIANEHNATCQVNIRHGYPMLFNSPEVTAKTEELAREFLGRENAIQVPERCTAEDFSYYLQQIPGTFMRVGVRNEALGKVHNLHSARFDADDEALLTAAGFLSYLVCNDTTN